MSSEFSNWLMATLTAVVTAILAIVQHVATKEKKTNAEQLKEMLELVRTLKEFENESDSDKKGEKDERQ